MISSDSEGNLCLSDTRQNYEMQRFISDALIVTDQRINPLSLSFDKKYLVYVGPSQFLITVLEINTLSQIRRIDISHCSFVTENGETLISKEAALFARFVSNRHIMVATNQLKLLKYDFLTGTILMIVRMDNHLDPSCSFVYKCSNFLD